MSITNAGWSVGTYCNASCKHCYSSVARREQAPALTSPEVDQIVHRLATFGILSVNLGGNEPVFTDGPDTSKSLLPHIIDGLSNRSMLVGLTTNGVTFDRLCQWPDSRRRLNDVDFSLDWAYRDKHNRSRGADLFDMVCNGLTEARAMGLPCSITMCATTDNFTLTHLRDMLGLCATYDAEFRINTFRPVREDQVEQMPTIAQYYEGFAFLCDHAETRTMKEPPFAAWCGAGGGCCPCGVYSLRVHPKQLDGTVPVSPCVFLGSLSCGDVLTQDLSEIVALPSFQRLQQRQELIPSACRRSTCRYLELCRGGCAARAYLTAETLDGADPYCPMAYDAMNPVLAMARPEVLLPSNAGIRVHDNYLCTWIGRPR